MVKMKASKPQKAQNSGLRLPAAPKWLSFAVACAGSAYLAFSGNALGVPLFVLSIALATVYAYAEGIYRRFPGRTTRGELLGRIALGALAVSMLLYVATKNSVFAILVFISLAALIIEEVIPKKWSAEEIRTNTVELAWALGAALFAWIFLTVALGTPSPIDVVTSCSMRPVLERGDLVFLMGGEANAPEAKYLGGGIGIVKKPCIIERNGKEEEGALCTEAIVAGNKTIGFDRKNDIVVYEPNPRITDLIIHRVFAKLRGADGQLFYMTRGDNNRQADQEAGLSLVPSSSVHGRVALRIPYLGFFKLFLFMQFDEPEGCDYIIKPVNQ